MNKARRFWGWLSGAHLTKDLDGWHARAFRLLNTALLFILFATTFMIGPLLEYELSTTATAAAFAVNGACQATFLFAFVLLRRGHIVLAGILCCLTFNALAGFLVFALPDEPNVGNLTILTLMAYLTVPRERKFWRICLFLLPVVWIGYYQVHFKVLGWTALFGPPQHVVSADRIVPTFLLEAIVIYLLLNTFVNAVDTAEARLKEEHAKSEKLLLNILPDEIAAELKDKGVSEPRSYTATVCFTDFKGFTQIAESLTPEELVGELDRCFSYFDRLMDRHNLEKLKTIGDSYMFAGGIPVSNSTHAVDCVMAALEIQAFMHQMKEIKSSQDLPYWELRLGIHSGDLIAGVIGEKKFAYDVWSDTVNTASRCESSGIPGRINISKHTYEVVKGFFDCAYRGAVPAKHKGEIDMYFVNGLLPELRRDGEERVPNAEFERRYAALSQLAS